MSSSNTPVSSKRPLEYSDHYGPNKRAPAMQPELDLEALVAELNQHTQTAGPSGGYDDAQSLEKQLEGALASLNAQSDLGGQPPVGLQLPGFAVPPQPGLTFPGHSSEYEAQIEAQLDGKIGAIPKQVYSAALEVKKRCMPILDSLACQILEYLSTGHYQEVLNLVTQKESEKGRAFRSVVDIFEQTKKIYLEGDCPFLNYTPELMDQRITLQRANLASWSAAVFGVIDIGFHDLDMWFLRIFVPSNSRLLKPQTSVYLELKTQAYISSLSQQQINPAEILNKLFPDDLGDMLLEQRSDRQTLNQNENDFVSRCAKRKDNIKGQTNQLELAKTYQWVFFLRDLTDYLAKHHYSLLPHPAQQLRAAQLQKKQQQEELAIAQQNARKRSPQDGAVALSGAPGAGAPPAGGPAPGTTPGASAPAAAPAAQAARPAQSQPAAAPATPASAQNSAASQAPQAAPQVPQAPQAPQAQAVQTPATPQPSTPQHRPSTPAVPGSAVPGPAVPGSAHAPGRALVPTASATALQQTPTKPEKPKHTRREWGEEAKRVKEKEGKISDADTLALYEAARMTPEGQENSRPPRQSVLTRRAWTPDEERALLMGLDKVQGPYWSQILELYGAGGSESEVLKDRSQVQLKDKARNLKMFFARCGIQMPLVFQYVTGDYNSRKSSGRKVRERKKDPQPRNSMPGMPQHPSHGQHPHHPGHGQHAPQHAGYPGQAAQSMPQMPMIPRQGEEDVQQSAEALDRALNMLKGGGEDNFQHLIQSVGEYMNNQ